MRIVASNPSLERADATRGFEAIADAIMYRWTVERDTWVSTAEVEQARAYLTRAGVPVDELSERGRPVEADAAGSLDAARLVLVGLRHLHATRRSVRRI